MQFASFLWYWANDIEKLEYLDRLIYGQRVIGKRHLLELCLIYNQLQIVQDYLVHWVIFDLFSKIA